MTDVWAACGGDNHFRPLGGEIFRIVESQEEVATLGLVDNLAEQAELERLLDATKPAAPATRAPLHYLLTTPFRYPPLRYGSRFGNRFEPSLFYGSTRQTTLFAEAAYYRFVFLEGMSTPLPKRLLTEHTVFSTRYQTRRGIDLTREPFNEYESQLASPSDYRASQKLGTSAREAGTQALQFVSARDAQGGSNVGLFTPEAIASRRPRHPRRWFAETLADTVTFSRRRGQILFSYPKETFLVDGKLPAPAV